MDKTLRSIILRQVPFLVGGTITGVIMTYYFGYLFSILVNSVIWYVISAVAYKLIWNSNGMKDQKYLFDYFMRKIKSR
jgi:hypothetical protein